MVTKETFDTKLSPHWCPGCGDYGAWRATKMALASLGLEPHQVLIVSGIGNAGKLPHWVRTYGFHGLHGRPLPVAQGAKLANHELTVLVVGGDGDGYGEGMSHFIHACRRNSDMTYIILNNGVYALTTGQVSPTSEKGFVSKSTPEGSPETPINPLALAIAAGATFVARGYTGKTEHLAKLIVEGVRHKGFAFLDVFQPCVVFNKVNTYKWYNERIYLLGKEYDPTDRARAFQKAYEWGDRIPLGVIYREEGKPTMEDETPQITKGPLVRQPLKGIDVRPLMEQLL